MQMEKVLQERGSSTGNAAAGHRQYGSGHDQPANATDQVDDCRHHHPGHNTDQQLRVGLQGADHRVHFGVLLAMVARAGNPAYRLSVRGIVKVLTAWMFHAGPGR